MHAGEYEARLRELESERQVVEEDRAQVDRYKQLLLKQRDIMIALTARLNERDEQIMTLQVGWGGRPYCKGAGHDPAGVWGGGAGPTVREPIMTLQGGGGVGVGPTVREQVHDPETPSLLPPHTHTPGGG